MATYRGAGQLVRQFSTSAVREKLAPVPLKLYGVHGRYATALYSAATKEKKIDVVEKEITAFQKLMKTDKKLNEFIFNPSHQKKIKKAAMTRLAQNQKYSSITGNFLALLAENGRLPKVGEVFGAFNKILSAQRGEINCSVTTAKPLTSAEEKDLNTVLQGFAKKGQSLILTMKVNPALIGGMVVNLGEDKLIDMSTATKMKKYAGLLKEAV